MRALRHCGQGDRQMRRGWLLALIMAAGMALAANDAACAPSRPAMRQLSAPFHASDPAWLAGRQVPRLSRRAGASPVRRKAFANAWPRRAARHVIALAQEARARQIGRQRRPSVYARQFTPVWSGMLAHRQPAPLLRGPRRGALQYGLPMRRAPYAHAVDVDQLLRFPPDSGPADDRLARAAAELGIPLIPGVPPIAIIAPGAPQKPPLEAIARRRAP